MYFKEIGFGNGFINLCDFSAKIGLFYQCLPVCINSKSTSGLSSMVSCIIIDSDQTFSKYMLALAHTKS